LGSASPGLALSPRALSESTIASEMAQCPIKNTSESKFQVTQNQYDAIWTPSPRIYPFCQNIFDHWDDDEEAVYDSDVEPTYFRHHGIFTSIRSSEKDDCGFCDQLLNTVPAEILEKHDFEMEEGQASQPNTKHREGLLSLDHGRRVNQAETRGSGRLEYLHRKKATILL
jgi:hypothetical protein